MGWGRGEWRGDGEGQLSEEINLAFKKFQNPSNAFTEKSFFLSHFAFRNRLGIKYKLI